MKILFQLRLNLIYLLILVTFYDCRQVRKVATLIRYQDLSVVRLSSDPRDLALVTFSC